MTPPRLTAIALLVLLSACAQQPNGSNDAFRGGPRDGDDAGGILHFDYDTPTSTTSWDFIGPARESADPAQLYSRADTTATPPAPHRTKVDAQALAAYMSQSLGAAVVTAPPAMPTAAVSGNAPEPAPETALTSGGTGVPVSTAAGTVLTSFPALNVANNPARPEPNTVIAVTVPGPGTGQDPAPASDIPLTPPVMGALVTQPAARPRAGAAPSLAPEVADDRANVFFRIGSSKLSATSVEALSHWAPRMMAALDDGKPVAVTGMTDPSGAIQTNERLAAERAGAVLDLLKLQGVDIGRLAVKLEPSPGLAATTSPSAETAARLRRVQLTIGASS